MTDIPILLWLAIVVALTVLSAWRPIRQRRLLSLSAAACSWLVAAVAALTQASLYVR